ncbi:MAG: hypothetical protein IJ743_01235 [Bacilli bacterium]|nr:hypothetical protein [Bacilli bacterium]
MKLEKFKEDNKKRKGILIFTVASILLLAGVFFYTSFAVYEDIKSFNIISGTIPDIGEVLYVYHLEDGTITTQASKVTGMVLKEEGSTCTYGVIPKWQNSQIVLDKTNATNTSSQKIRCDLHMVEPPASQSLKVLASLNPNYIPSTSDKCVQVDENGMILNPDSAMSDSDTPIICSMEDDYGTSYYLRGNHTSNNVKFANMCWKLVRVTGSGGYKLIYNGDLDANGKCTTTSGNHTGFTGQTLSLSGDKVYGTSYTYDGSTYTLSDTSTMNFSTDSASIIGKYTCANTSDNCENLYYVVSNDPYVLKIGVSTNYAQIGTSEFNTDYYQTPSHVGYMYNDVYDRENRSLLDNTNNYYYGESFTYNNGSYTLNNTVQFAKVWTNNNEEKLNSHHYTCFNASDNTCQELYFIYALEYDEVARPNLEFYETFDILYYIKLKGNETGPEALNKMVNNNDINIKNSLIKEAIDWWYEQNFKNTQYESYLEDTIFCNDRTIDDIGGWSETGITSNSLTFNSGNNKYYLKCPSKRDAFTASDITYGNNALTYPVGLLTTAEHSLIGNYTANITGDSYWSSAPDAFSSWRAYELEVDSDGRWGISYFYSVGNESGIRPSISLRPGTTFKGGTDGTAANPFEVVME